MPPSAFQNIYLFSSSSTQSSVAPSPETMLSGSTVESTLSTEEVTHAFAKISEAIDRLGFDFESLGVEGTSLLSMCNPEVQVSVPQGATLPTISCSSRGRQKSWLLNYSVISFLMNGQLFSEYDRISNMLGLPHCSDKYWREIVGWLGEYVTRLAEWSCSQVRDEVCARGDSEHWVTSYDGYYLTRGHHSNNCSATLHDYSTGKIAYFQHRTKRDVGHNWEGTSAGAEADMFNEAKEAGFVISEMVTDKDSSMNSIYCRHFPEGTITYCSNHNVKTMHKDLQKVKSLKCQVSIYTKWAGIIAYYRDGVIQLHHHTCTCTCTCIYIFTCTYNVYNYVCIYM